MLSHYKSVAITKHLHTYTYVFICCLLRKKNRLYTMFQPYTFFWFGDVLFYQHVVMVFVLINSRSLKVWHLAFVDVVS